MTHVITSLPEWQALRKSNAFKGKTLGFVPTMGALHAGHRSLLQHCHNENDLSILSIFVNPTQFNNAKDLHHYPRMETADLAIAQAEAVNFVLIPSYAEVYPDNYHYQVSETTLSKQLCGAHRQGHFTGILTIVMKLLQLTQPTRIYLGEKDYQQYLLIKDMIKTFFLETIAVACPTIRDSDGLALSSRNQLLTAEQRKLAAKFPQLLTSTTLSSAEVHWQLEDAGFRVDYIEEHFGRRFGAVYLGNVRLIDNVKL